MGHQAPGFSEGVFWIILLIGGVVYSVFVGVILFGGVSFLHEEQKRGFRGYFVQKEVGSQSLGHLLHVGGSGGSHTSMVNRHCASLWKGGVWFLGYLVPGVSGMFSACRMGV